MDRVREELRRSRIRNFSNTKFITENKLDDLFTLDLVNDLLKHANIEPHEQHHIEKHGLRGNVRVFAILVSIERIEKIQAFIRSDQYRRGANLDHMLPFSREYLKSILDEDSATHFYDEQWEYAAPIFSRCMIPRMLDNNTILPIISEKSLGRGYFGQVFEIEIHQAHHTFKSAGNKFVRKQLLEPDEVDASAEFEKELRNLAILGSNQHPYIINLLCAYTWKNTHNFVFPLMDNTLDEFLMMEERPTQFASDALILIALAQLSLALKHVHDFIASHIDLALIGCHHDLKPDNILLDGESFILADFGLSTFKSGSQDSKTTHEKGNKDYLAPECERLKPPDFAKGKVGRKKDIWAFGCIIIEVLMYMSKGSDGLKSFREKRKYTIEVNGVNWTFHQFHRAGGPSDEVEREVSDLEKGSKTSRHKLIGLVRKMLQPNPEARPSMKEVASDLRAVALLEQTYSIEELFQRLQNAIKDEDERDVLFIEQARFSSWKETCKFAEAYNKDLFNDIHGFNFEKCTEVLKNYTQTLQELADESVSVNRTNRFVPLNHANGHLQNLLPGSLTESFRLTLVRNTVGIIDDSAQLKRTEDTLKTDPSSCSISQLARVKLMIKAMDEYDDNLNEGTTLEIKVDCVHLERTIDHHHFGKVTEHSSEPTRPVFIEWLLYHKPVLPENQAKQLVRRVNATTRFLKDIPHPPNCRLLRCANFFHDVQQSRFGFIFNFPSHITSDEPKFYLLSGLLELSKTNQQLTKPSLGERFHLARSLASSISEFHKAGWLHRNISPFNILLFSSADGSIVYSQPYLTGFSCSRPNKPNEFTEGPGEEYLSYQHPEYTKYRKRYCSEFDYYSFGILLLEIAHWSLLSRLTRSKFWKVLNPWEFRSSLIETIRFSSLAHNIGDAYFNAIKACLNGPPDFQVHGKNRDSVDQEQRVQDWFQRDVIDRLQTCSA